MDSKIHIRSGDLEIDCEGSEDFLKQEFPKILEAVAGLRRNSAGPEDLSAPVGSPTIKPANPNSLTVTSVAAKFACKSGPDLLEAAAAKLVVVDGLADI